MVVTKLLQITWLGAAAVSVSACATVTRGTTTAWTVNAAPQSAAVRTSNGLYCPSTPCTLQMPRKAKFIASISRRGYKTIDVQVGHHVSAAGAAGFLGNALIGGLVGASIDIATGATLDLNPNDVSVALEKDLAIRTFVDEPQPWEPPPSITEGTTRQTMYEPGVGG